MSDKEAADHARTLTASAMLLTDKLLDDLNDRSDFSLDADVRGILRDEWIVLIAKDLIARGATDRPILDERFVRPVVCAWCGNRHRSIASPDNHTQGDACASSVFQVTEEFRARAQTAQASKRSSSALEALARAATIPIDTWLVQGHYGSNYDCALFRFVQNMPTAPAEPICDNCIGERIVAGDLERIEGQYP